MPEQPSAHALLIAPSTIVAVTAKGDIQLARSGIKHNIRAYRQWGYEMVKHDFSTVDLFGKWGFQMIADRDLTFPGWHFNNQSLTNAEVVLQLYAASFEQPVGEPLDWQETPFPCKWKLNNRIVEFNWDE